jgi:hypothetical protein
LARDACVYLRQSTVDQLLNNPESRRRQYDLVTRACSLGWERVIVIDDDLGRSGSGRLCSGFERPLAAICAGSAGAVLAIEASRLARNGRDWNALLEFCAFVNSRIIDEGGIYDPRQVNDRLLLGLKGTLGELEFFHQRARGSSAQGGAAAGCTPRRRVATDAELMIASNRILTRGSVKRCRRCSASLTRLAACVRSSYGFGRSELTCRLLSMVLKGGPRSDAGRANCLRLISALVSRKRQSTESQLVSLPIPSSSRYTSLSFLIV